MKLNYTKSKKGFSRKYKNINKYFVKKKTSKEETVILYYASDKNSSSSSKGDNWLNGGIYAFIIDKLKPNSRKKIKEHTLSSNNLDKALHDSHLLNTLQNPTNKKDKQT